MAKPVESSAINHLINMVATRTPPVRDPAEDLADLMFRVPPARPLARTLPPPPVTPVTPVTPVREEAPAPRPPPKTQAPPIAPTMVPARMAPEPQSLTDLAATVPVRKRPPDGAFEDPGSIASLVHARSAPASRQPPVRVLDISRPPVAPRPRTGRHAPVIVEDGPPTDQITDEFEGTTADRVTAPRPRQPRPTARRDVAAPTTTPPLRMPSAAPYDRPLDFADVSVDVPPARDGTAQIVRRPPWRHFARTLALPMLALFVVGAGIGGYAALRKRHHAVTAPAEPAAALATASTPTVAPHARTPGALESAVLGPEAVPPVAAPAAAVAVEPAPAPAPAPTPPTSPHALVEVRIDSTPSGATVMMVDRGTTTPIGTTPLFASVDPSRPYELVFTLVDHPTRVLSLDAARTVRIAAALDGAPDPAPSPSPAPAPSSAPAPAPSPLPSRSHAPKPKHRPTPTAPSPAVAEARGTGILMISSKPPCQISIDGKPTGLTTPQRAISLSAGRHSITLVNAAAGVKKTVTATIKADTSTKVIQDLMSQ